MKLVFSFFLFLLSIPTLTSQVPETFLVDSMSLSAKQTLPFDRPFILGFLGTSAKSIYSAFLFEWVINGDATRTLKSQKSINGNGALEYTFIQTENVFNLANGTDMYIPAQPPSRNFAILLNHRFDGDLLDEALQASWYLYKNDASNADTVLNRLYEKVESKKRPAPGNPLSELKYVSAFAFDWLKSENGAVMVSENNTDINASIKKGFTNFYNVKLDSIYDSQSITFSSPVSLTASNVSAIVQTATTSKLSTVEFSPLVSLLSRSLMISLMEGKVAFQKDLLTSQVQIHQLPARLKNLNTSLTEIEKLRQYCELAQAQLNNEMLAQLIIDLGTLRSSLESNRDRLKKVSAGVLMAISEEANLIYNSLAFANNEVWDLKTRGSYQVIPYIGIATIVGIGNEKNEVIVRPSLGANIYFRPVDKNVPFNYFDKKYRLLHRLSASVGVTVGKTEQGEFSDFFNNMCLLMGGNYKITREFSFSAGLSFLKRSNANLAIEEKTTTLMPYIGISFDIDFLQTIQKLTGKFSL